MNMPKKQTSPNLVAKMGLSCAIDEIEDAILLINESNCRISELFDSEEARKISAILGGAYALLKNSQNTVGLAINRIE